MTATMANTQVDTLLVPLNVPALVPHDQHMVDGFLDQRAIARPALQEAHQARELRVVQGLESQPVAAGDAVDQAGFALGPACQHGGVVNLSLHVPSLHCSR